MSTYNYGLPGDVEVLAQRLREGTPYALENVNPAEQRFLLVSAAGRVIAEAKTHDDIAIRATFHPTAKILTPQDQVNLANECYRNHTSDERWP